MAKKFMISFIGFVTLGLALWAVPVFAADTKPV
jgi:hypothetical protein